MVDRREALKKLGAAGAVVVGGSAVLSSRSVAFAASAGTCVAVIPDTVPLRFTQPNGSPRLLKVRWQNSRPPGASSQTYSWRNAQIVPPTTTGGVEILGSTSREMSLRRITAAPRARDRVWVVGDNFKVQVKVTWTCSGSRRDEITYEITEQARARGSQWTNNALRVS
jgi:hypothetical protein